MLPIIIKKRDTQERLDNNITAYLFAKFCPLTFAIGKVQYLQHVTFVQERMTIYYLRLTL